MITSIEIKGLYGLYDYKLNFLDENPVTIITGPNGFGKTTLLKIISYLYSCNFWYFCILPFHSLFVSFTDKNNEKSTVTDVWQTIEFKIDNSVSKPQTDENKDMSYDVAMAMDLENSDENRNFSFTNPFAIFLKESTSDMPYFAAYIEDISKFE